MFACGLFGLFELFGLMAGLGLLWSCLLVGFVRIVGLFVFSGLRLVWM